MASLRFDLPQPLGPTMAAMPAPLKRRSVLSAKDLKPCSSTRLSFSNGLSLPTIDFHHGSRVVALGGERKPRIHGFESDCKNIHRIRLGWWLKSIYMLWAGGGSNFFTEGR